MSVPDTFPHEMQPDPDGKVTIRDTYKDGRTVASVTLRTGDWWVEVFSGREAVDAFAAEYNLEVVDVDESNHGA